MVNVNRHTGWGKEVILADIKSGVTVEVGDLMFLDNTDNLRADGSSIANYNAYPISYLRVSGSSLELNKRELKTRFIGVAMDDKDGVGDDRLPMKISIATNGKFKYKLKPAKTIKNGNIFGPSGTTSGSNMYNQKIMKTTETEIALGYFAESKTYATEAEVLIRTAFGGKDYVPT